MPAPAEGDPEADRGAQQHVGYDAAATSDVPVELRIRVAHAAASVTIGADHPAVRTTRPSWPRKRAANPWPSVQAGPSDPRSQPTFAATSAATQLPATA